MDEQKFTSEEVVDSVMNELERIDAQQAADETVEQAVFSGPVLDDEEKVGITRRALCIGINRYPSPNTLAGCVNDARAWGELLTGLKYQASYLLDGAATKEGIIAALKKIVAATKSGHAAVITYSGHGTRVVDRSGDEADGYDEAICPVDCMSGQVITDDELYEIFAAQADGADIMFISDSCHSGTVTRGESGGVCERFIHPAAIFGADTDRAQIDQVLAPRADRPAIVVGLEACRPTEYSYDAVIGGRPCGAYTHHALAAYRQLDAGATRADWHRAISGRLPSVEYPMHPQIEGPVGALGRVALGE
jgi:metacaspase-1